MMSKLELKMAALDAAMYGLARTHNNYRRLYPKIETQEGRDDAEYVMLEIVTRINTLKLRKERAKAQILATPSEV